MNKTQMMQKEYCYTQLNIDIWTTTKNCMVDYQSETAPKYRKQLHLQDLSPQWAILKSLSLSEDR